MKPDELKRRRKAAYLRQSELGERASVRQSHLSEMEAGTRPIGRRVAARLEAALSEAETQLRELEAWFERTKDEAAKAPHLVELRRSHGFSS